MCPAWPLGGLALWLACATLAMAQGAGPKTMTIMVEEAKVYSHPGTNALVTGALRRGAEVKVFGRREDGWLEIAPPDGSFCWINDRFVRQLGNSLQVAGQVPVPLRVGSVLSPERPTDVETATVSPGTQLVARARQPITVEGSRWWTVLPNPSERRYIPATAVTGTSAPTASSPPQAPASGAPAGQRASQDADTLWKQAQELERVGNLAEAQRLYAELARVTTDETLRILALNRAQFLRDSPRAGPASPPFRPAVSAPPPAFQPVAQSRPSASRPAPGYPIGTAPAAGLGATTQLPGTPVRSGPGRLERVAFPIDGRKAYALVSSEGLPRLYVTAEDGVNLEGFVNRNVELVGPTIYHGQLRTNYMRVRQVLPLQ